MSSYNSFDNYVRERNIHRRILTAPPLSVKHDSLLTKAAATDLLHNVHSQARAVQSRLFGKTVVASEGGESSIQPFGVLGLIPQQEFVMPPAVDGSVQQLRLVDKLKAQMLRAVTSMSVVTTNRPPAFIGPPSTDGASPFFVVNDPTVTDNYPKYAGSDRIKKLGSSAISVIVSCREGGVEVSEVSDCAVRPILPLFHIDKLKPPSTSFPEAFASPLLKRSAPVEEVQAASLLQATILDGKSDLPNKVEVLKKKMVSILTSHAVSYPPNASPIPSFLAQHLADIDAQDDFADAPGIIDACLMEEVVDSENAVLLFTATAAPSTQQQQPAAGTHKTPSPALSEDDIQPPCSDDDGNDPKEFDIPISEIRLRKIIGNPSQGLLSKKSEGGGIGNEKRSVVGSTATPTTDDASSLAECSLLNEDVDAWRGYRNPTHLCTIALLTEPFRVKHPTSSVSAIESVQEELSSSAFPAEKKSDVGGATSRSATRKGTWWAQKVIIVRCSTVIASGDVGKLREDFLEEGFASHFVSGAMQTGEDTTTTPSPVNYPPYLSRSVHKATEGICDGSQEELKLRIGSQFKEVRSRYNQLLKHQMTDCGVVYEVEREHTFRIVPALGVQSAPMPVLVSIRATPRITHEVHVCHQLPGVEGRQITRNARRPVVVEGGQLILTTAASYGKYSKLSSEEGSTTWEVVPSIPTDLLAERLLVLSPTAIDVSKVTTTPPTYEMCSGLSPVREIPSAAVIAEWNQLLPLEISALTKSPSSFGSLAQREQLTLTTVLGEQVAVQSNPLFPSAIIAKALSRGGPTRNTHSRSNDNINHLSSYRREGPFLSGLTQACADLFLEGLLDQPQDISWAQYVSGAGGIGRTTVPHFPSPFSSSSSPGTSTTTPSWNIPLAPMSATVSVSSRLLAYAGAPFVPGAAAPCVADVIAAAFKQVGVPECTNNGLYIKSSHTSSATTTPPPPNPTETSSAPVFTFLLECVQSEVFSPSLSLEQASLLKAMLVRWIAIESTVNQYASSMGAEPIIIDLSHRRSYVTLGFVCYVVRTLSDILVGHQDKPLTDAYVSTRHNALFHLAGGVVPQYVGPEYASRLRSGAVSGDNIPYSWVTAMTGLDTAVTKVTNTLLSILKFRCEMAKIVMSETDVKGFELSLPSQAKRTEFVDQHVIAFKHIVEGSSLPASKSGGSTVANPSTLDVSSSTIPPPPNRRGLVTFLQLAHLGNISREYDPYHHYQVDLDPDTSLPTDDIQMISLTRNGRHVAIATTDAIDVTIYRISRTTNTNDVVRGVNKLDPAYVLRRGRLRSQLGAIQFSPMGTCVAIVSAGSGSVHVYLLEPQADGVVAPPVSLLSAHTLNEGPPIKVLSGDGNDCEKAIRELCRRLDGHRPDLLRWPYPLVSFVEEKRLYTPPSSNLGTDLDPSALKIAIVSAAANSIVFGSLFKRGAPPALHWSSTSSDQVNISKYSHGFVGWGVDCSPPRRILSEKQSAIVADDGELAPITLPEDAAVIIASAKKRWRQEYYRVSKPVAPPNCSSQDIGPSGAVLAVANLHLRDVSVDLKNRHHITTQELAMLRRFSHPRITSFEETIRAAVEGKPINAFMDISTLGDQPLHAAELTLGEETMAKLGLVAASSPTSTSAGSGPTSPLLGGGGGQGSERAPSRSTSRFHQRGLPPVQSIDSGDLSRFADQAHHQWAAQEAERGAANMSRESLSSPTWQNISMQSDEQVHFKVDDVE